jgi:hypothetical protein
VTVESLERFQRNRQVIEDFASRTLAAIPGDYARLLYLTSLRDLATGRYAHEGLANLYPEAAVQEALAFCHEELLVRILETPLERQEWDLRTCLADLEGEFWGTVAHWREEEFYRLMVPAGVPGYLRDLFCSNVRVLLAAIAAERPIPRPAA